MFPISVSVPNRFPPLVTYGLIAANAVAFFLLASLPPVAQEAVAHRFGLVPARYGDPQWALRVGLDPGNVLPFVTGMFLHGGWLHLILNMCALAVRSGDRRSVRFAEVRGGRRDRRRSNGEARRQI
jgi:membrane associated rhomboid family serine protease